MSFELYTDEFQKFWEHVKKLQDHILKIAENLRIVGKAMIVYASHGKIGVNLNFESFDIPREITRYFKKVIEETFKKVKYTSITDFDSKGDGTIINIEIKATYGE